MGKRRSEQSMSGGRKGPRGFFWSRIRVEKVELSIELQKLKEDRFASLSLHPIIDFAPL